MSELIDKIVDVEKISGEVSTLLKSLADIEKAINRVNDLIKNDESGSRKAKDFEDLSRAAKSLNENFTAGQKPLKDFQTQLAELKTKTEQLTGSEKSAAIEIAKARLELAAAQKETKAAALAEIELTSQNKSLAGSYDALNKDLKDSIKAYKALSGEEANSAKGKELLSKIGETQSALKKSDAAMGNYQRNVGNYQSAVEGLTPKLGGLAGKLLEIAQAAAKSRDELNEAGGDNGLGVMARPRIPAGLATIMTGFKGIGQSVVAMGKAVLANPIIAVVSGLVLVFTQIKKAISESEERTNKFSEAMSRLKPILRTIGDVFEVIADGFLSFLEIGGKAIAVVTEWLGLNPKGSADAFVAAEKMKQNAILETRKLNEQAAEQQAIIAEQREIIADKEAYTYAQRVEALKKAGAAEKKLSDDKAKIAKINLEALKAEADLDDNNAEMNDKLSAATIALSEARKESAAIGRKLAKEEQNLSNENQADMKAEAEAAKAAMDKIISARRRLVDSGFEIQKESEAKAAAMSKESFNREVEDLKRNGELTKELLKNLTIKQAQDQDVIKKEWNEKRKEEAAKTAEEVLAIELKRIDDAIKGVEKQTQELSTEYNKQYIDLKKQFSKGLISREEYEKKAAKLQLDSLLDINEKTIQANEKLLQDSALSDEKRSELSAQLAQLRIQNENAVTDAAIQANEDQVKSDEDAKQKRIAVAQALGNATNQVFGAISEFAIQESERKIEALEKELEASNTAFEGQQANLDNAIMSDETRAERQNALNERKYLAEKTIKDKIQAEKIKQAKWDKAQAIVNAIISAGLSVLSALSTKPFIPLGLIAAGLATTMGAIQVATIARQPLPAYEHGGVTGSGLALWGEVRPEVAVTSTGETFVAEKPTISNFDAGTRIFKSVSDYENFINAKNSSKFEFDYEKFGAKMPQNNIILDGSGLWSIVNKQNARVQLINRRYSR